MNTRKKSNMTMKKMMMTAFAVVLAAGIVSAASMDWTVGAQFVTNGNLPLGKDWGTGSGQVNPAAGAVTYALVLSTDLSTALDLILPSAGDGSFISTIGNNSNAVFLDWGISTGQRGQMAASTATTGKITTSALNYVVIAFMEVEGAWYYKYSGSTSGTGYTSDPDDGFAPNFVAGTFNSGMSGWGMIPVPEPTALALLALGVAAVGLRRRFRK